jgi:hypothetical protein
MAHRKWLILGALAVSFASMASANPFAGINDDPSARLLFAMDPFENPISHSYSLGDAKEKVLSRFGDPSEMTISTQETRWPGETQTSYRLTYKDAIFVINRTNDQPSTWIEQIEITGNAHRLKFGIRIGAPRAEIVSQFSPEEHHAASNPMLVSIPTLETRSIFEKKTIETVGYTPTVDITFEFDEDDRLTRLSIFTAADE